MAGKDILNQLAKSPPLHKLALLAVAAGIVGAGYYQFSYSDLVEKRTNLENRKAGQLQQQRKLNNELKEQKKLAQKNEELQRDIRDNMKALPTKAELPAFFDHLQRKAGDSGVTIQRWERKKEEALDIYIRVPVEIELRGSFYSIMHYFALLGPRSEDSTALLTSRGGDGEKSERVDERIVSIENLELTNPKLEDGELQLSAKFVASTFRLAAPPPGTTTPGAAAQPGAKQAPAAAATGGAKK